MVGWIMCDFFFVFTLMMGYVRFVDIRMLNIWIPKFLLVVW